jgi:hypothetical protein
MSTGFWIGLLVLVTGVAALGRGREWHDEAGGPRFPSGRLGPVAHLFRNGVGPIAVEALPIQLFGIVWVAAAILMMVSVVPTEQAPRLAVGVLVGGISVVAAATALTRFVVWLRHRDRAS